MATIMGYWDCKYCDTKGIKGTEYNCPNCGKPRDEHTMFYLKREKEQVTSEEKKKIGQGPDWVCEYCGSLNKSCDTICDQCGSERTKENKDYFQNKKEKQNKKQDEDFVIKSVHINTDKQKIKQLIPKIGILAGILLVAVIMFFVLVPKVEEVTVNAMSWEREIEIERYQTVHESDWTLPPDARLSYTQSEIHHFDTVLDHYETKTRQVAKQRLVGYSSVVSGYRDNGNGTFDEIIAQEPQYETYYETETYQEPVYVEVPVYQTKYYYEIDKWIYERSVETSGLDKNPVWGEVNLKTDEREGNHIEKYTITVLKQNGKEKTLTVEYDKWTQLNIGDSITIKCNEIIHPESEDKEDVSWNLLQDCA